MHRGLDADRPCERHIGQAPAPDPAGREGPGGRVPDAALQRQPLHQHLATCPGDRGDNLYRQTSQRLETLYPNRARYLKVTAFWSVRIESGRAADLMGHRHAHQRYRRSKASVQVSRSFLADRLCLRLGDVDSTIGRSAQPTTHST